MAFQPIWNCKVVSMRVNESAWLVWEAPTYYKVAPTRPISLCSEILQANYRLQVSELPRRPID